MKQLTTIVTRIGWCVAIVIGVLAMRGNTTELGKTEYGAGVCETEVNSEGECVGCECSSEESVAEATAVEAGAESGLSLERTIRLTTLAGNEVVTLPVRSDVGFVVVFLNPECPIARRMIPELNALHADFSKRGLKIYGVVFDPETTRSEAVAWRDEYRVEFPVLLDHGCELTRLVEPTHSPEAFVYGPKCELVYRGRINNRFETVGRPRLEVTEFELRRAMEALAVGETSRRPYVAPVGCPVELPSSEEQQVTYYRDVAPIVVHQCAACHRNESVAPFVMLDWEDSAKRSEWIVDVVEAGVMPPWNAEIGPGKFHDERYLTGAELHTLRLWDELGAPAGDPADRPQLPSWSDAWDLGEPDQVLTMPEPVEVAADGPDQFRYIQIELNNPEPMWLEGVEFVPGNPKVVHHAIVGVVPKDFALQLGEAAEMPGFDPIKDGLPRFAKMFQRKGVDETFGLLTAWTPGSKSYRFPEGVGFKIPAHANLLLQMHYYPSGKVETDQSRVGLHWSDGPLERSAGGFGLNVLNLAIPPDVRDHVEATSLELPVDVTLLGVTPHMHLLGQAMTIRAQRPGEEEFVVVDVKSWDWNWQGQYRFVEPLELPQGTRLSLEAHFDNSAANPVNPNQPPQEVRFGRKTTDEMCLCFIQVVLEDSADQGRLRRAAFDNILSGFGWDFTGFLKSIDGPSASGF